MKMRLYEVKWSLRQSPWTVATGVFDTIRSTKLIICSGYHSHDKCPEGELIFDKQNTRGNIYALEIEIGDYAIIFEKGNVYTALLVRISSGVYRKVIPEITIYRKSDHKNQIYPNSDVVEVCLTGQQTREFTHSETMIAYVRDVEVICELEYIRYYEIIDMYNRLRSSITRLTCSERYITV